MLANKTDFNIVDLEFQPPILWNVYNIIEYFVHSNNQNKIELPIVPVLMFYAIFIWLKS